MGKVLYISANAKVKNISSRSLKPLKSFIDSDSHNKPDGHEVIKYFYREEDKHINYFSVSNWLDTRKKASKYRANNSKKHKLE
ncbi:MAG: hypothetical protein ACOY46_08595 [Bacillota bacterium]